MKMFKVFKAEVPKEWSNYCK